MIILLAMINSLAAREPSRRGPRGPPDRAARGVYAGDGEKLKSGDTRRRFKGLSRRDSAATKRPRRADGGRSVADWPSEHRQPENKTRLRTPPFTRRRLAPRSRSEPRWLQLAVSPRTLAGASRLASGPTGRQPAPGAVRETRRPSYDGPGARLAQSESEPAAQTRSESVTRHK
jgi:hypothetical protein